MTDVVNLKTTSDSPLPIVAGFEAGKPRTLVERTLHHVKSGVELKNVMVANAYRKSC